MMTLKSKDHVPVSRTADTSLKGDINLQTTIAEIKASFLSIVLYLFIIASFIFLAFKGAETMGYNWQWYQIPKYFFKFTDDGLVVGEFIVGLGMTLTISALSFILAVVLGFVIAALRLSDLVVGRALAKCILEFLRNSPLLVLLYLFYYVMGPVLGWDRYVASIACLGIFHAALISEILRAGINSLPKGQWEAAESLGMTKLQTYYHIIIPQIIRFVLPPTTGELIQVIKNSAIVSVLAVVELTTIGRNIISDTYMSFEIWFTVAAIYFVLMVLLSSISSKIERKFTFKPLI